MRENTHPPTTFHKPPDRNRPVVREEFKERVLDNRRVTRVVAGGKRFRFRCTIVLGDERGRIGIGVAKGLDVQQAVAKAKADAKKNMLTIKLKDGRTISHEVIAKYSAAKVLIKPASKGHGLRAGGSVRFVLAFAGIKDATAKSAWPHARTSLRTRWLRSKRSRN